MSEITQFLETIFSPLTLLFTVSNLAVMHSERRSAHLNDDRHVGFGVDCTRCHWSQIFGGQAERIIEGETI